jgi:hypothetical protein
VGSAGILKALGSNTPRKEGRLQEKTFSHDILPSVVVESCTSFSHLDRKTFKVLQNKKILVVWSIPFRAKINAHGKLVWFVVCIWLMGYL